MDVTSAGPSGPSVKKEDMTTFMEKPHTHMPGGQLRSTGVVTVTLPLKDQRLAWIPT